MKTSELTGAALDWAVAQAEGLLHDDGTVSDYWQPSVLWEQGGAIIEREGLGIARDDQGVWFASYELSADCAWGATGKTPLIAAMRCYVAAHLDDEINVPEELL